MQIINSIENDLAMEEQQICSFGMQI